MSEFWKANKRKTASKENPCSFGIQELGQDHNANNLPGDLQTGIREGVKENRA